MRVGRRAILVVGLFAALCIFASCASAKTTSSSVSGPFGPQAAVSYTLTDWASALVFPKFDSALGTLTRVDMSITADIQTMLTITNVGNGDSQGDAKTHVVVTVTDPGSLLSLAPDLYSQAFDYTLASGGSIISGTLIKSGSASGSWTDALILAEFNGPGSITMNASTVTETVIANTGGNTDAGQVTNADADGMVTYYYTPVPEPNSLLALSSLIGAGFFAIRRRS